MVRRYLLIIGFLVCGLLAAARADTFQLTTGKSVTGELLTTSANDTGVQIKIADGDYERVPWASFSQEDLKKFVKIKKLESFVEPFIEITQEEKIKRTEVPNLKQPTRLERPAAQSLLGAMCSSGLGLLVMLALYAANIYAGYEVSIFRAQPWWMVCGAAAVLPIVGPIVFLSMPTRMQAAQPSWEPPPEQAAAAAEAVNPMLDTTAQHPTSLKLEDEPAQESKPELPAATTFQRGQFTFNRRFIETKFAGFFGLARREADRDMVLVIKAARGEYIADRITRITANDFHIQVHKGHASEEIMVPFVEVQQIILKHRDAK
jgi:hypothetical protein